jgi:hypothetical protein
MLKLLLTVEPAPVLAAVSALVPVKLTLKLLNVASPLASVI